MPGILQSYAMGVPAGWIARTVGHHEPGLLEALSQEARAMAESLTVVVGARGEA